MRALWNLIRDAVAFLFRDPRREAGVVYRNWPIRPRVPTGNTVPPAGWDEHPRDEDGMPIWVCGWTFNWRGRRKWQTPRLYVPAGWKVTPPPADCEPVFVIEKTGDGPWSKPRQLVELPPMQADVICPHCGASADHADGSDCEGPPTCYALDEADEKEGDK